MGGRQCDDAGGTATARVYLSIGGILVTQLGLAWLQVALVSRGPLEIRDAGWFVAPNTTVGDGTP